jgi:hypothetical protein
VTVPAAASARSWLGLTVEVAQDCRKYLVDARVFAVGQPVETFLVNMGGVTAQQFARRRAPDAGDLCKVSRSAAMTALKITFQR